MARSQPAQGYRRVVIEGVSPEIDCGRFPIKRTAGESVVVEADIFADGHDAVAGAVRFRAQGASAWSEVRMEPAGNDRFRGEFPVPDPGWYEYTVIGWIDAFGTWVQDLEKRIGAGQDVSVDLLIGAELVRSAAARATDEAAASLAAWAAKLASTETGVDERVALARSEPLVEAMRAHPDLSRATEYGRWLSVVVDRARAGFSTWYEMFPRSASPDPDRHGTFRDVIRLLPRIAGLGFDVLYFPPIHPIGRTFRKGKNNAPVAGPDDVGSPWGIGGVEGGHKAIHPELGTEEDFQALLVAAKEHGIEIALDIAFQVSPDHPYVEAHPEWFRKRPDGTIQYAENPPKKYQDIYPFDFESPSWRALWDELIDVVRYWASRGVRIFRVDNPHTKPFDFWERLIREIKEEYPDALFLAEAFTRPKVMYRLAKLGFTQSYTYFAWRNTKHELIDYLTELTRTQVREYFRPNFWPNTPDILTEYLQAGGRVAFQQRLILAATLAANYGIYGPAFELMERRAKEPGSEEYLDSEKYEIRRWNLDRPDSLAPLIARVNRIRREHPALQSDRQLRFHRIDNDFLLAYSKSTPGLEDVILVVVNLDLHHTQSGWVELPLAELGIPEHEPFHVHDLLSDAHYLWQGAWNYVELSPHAATAHIFQIGGRARTEHDFETYQE